MPEVSHHGRVADANDYTMAQVSPTLGTASATSTSTACESDRIQTEQIFPNYKPQPSRQSTTGDILRRLSHRQNTRSMDSIPRQPFLDPLETRGRQENNDPGSLAYSISGMLSSPKDNKDHHDSLRTRRFASASLHLSSARARAQSAARMPLGSPCFFHQRFDDAINVEKVLEDVATDDWMSHSRLVQTATGVREVSKQLQRRPIKLEVKNVMIVTKARDNNLVYLTRELTEWLLSTPRYGSDLGVNVYVDAKLQSSKRFNAEGLLSKERRFESMLKYWTPDLCWEYPETFDLVITLGGDGTVLFTSWLFQRIVPPVLSFSLGSLGFLTNFEFTKYKEHLNHIMGDVGMRVNLRMRFTCTVYRADRQCRQRPAPVEEGEKFEVVNEMVIDRGPSPYVSNLEVYGDNELLTVVQADGCIFSTPTGMCIHFLLKTHPSNTPSRINGIFPLRRRLPHPPLHPSHPLNPNLPAHPLLPPHGTLRHPPSAHCHSPRLSLNRILFLRRQRTHRASTGRLCHRRSERVPVPNCRVEWRGVVREREAHSAVECARGGAERVGWG